MPENMKRKITVESSSTKKDSQPRPSVFDRLGKKSSASSTTTAVVVNNESSGICRHWAAAGNCPYGKNCKYAVTHTLISPSKQRAAKKDIVETKQKLNANTTHSVTTLKSSIPTKEDINKRLHSAVIRKGRTGTGGSPDLNWENWDQTDLEYEDEKVLEKRRQLLQRELELQMTKEKDDHQKKKKVKKIKKGASSGSSTSASSSSSTESTSSSDDSSSTSSSTSIDSRKKKAKKNTKRDSSSSTSGTDHATSKKKNSKSAKSGTLSTSKKTPPAHKEDHRSGSSKVQESSTSKKPVSAPTNQTQSSMKKRSTTPQDRSKRRSQTPPHLNDASKEKASGAAKKPTPSSNKHNLSPVAKRTASADRKRGRSVSPHPSGRDKEKAKSKDRDKDREREKDREKDRDSGRNSGRNGTPPKGKPKDRVASPKRNSRGPRDPRKRDSPETGKDKRRQSPSKSRRSSSRGRTRDDGTDKRAPLKNATAVSRDADRRDVSRNDSRDSRGAVKNSERDSKKNDDSGKVTKSNKESTKSTSSSGRGRDDPIASKRSENSVVSSRETGRKMLPAPATKSGVDREISSKGDKDRNKDARDNSRDSRGGRDNARDGRGTNKDSADPRLPRNTKNIREMREAEREKEREEALERCRERQRERERKAQERDRKVQERDRKTHELEEKAREHERELPSLLMIATHNPIKSVRNGGREDSKGRDKGSERGSDRSHEKDRGSDRDRDLDKGGDRERTNDRGSDRDRGPTSRAVERDRDRDRAIDRSANDKDRDRTADRNVDRSHDRDRALERERGFDRGLDHERPLDRDRGIDRGPLERDRGQERDRQADRGPLDRDRTFDRGLDRAQNKSPHRSMNRGLSDRSYDRNTDHGFEREPDRSAFERDNRESERDYQSLGRGRDDVRRPPLGPDDKGSGYDSPYDPRRGREERGRYSDQMERTRYDDTLVTREDARRPGVEPRNYPEDRRGRRDPRSSLEPAWEGRNRESPENRRRSGYGDEPRSPPPIKGRPGWEPPPGKARPDWDQRDYGDGRREWDGRGGGRRGPPLDWDSQRRGDWLEKDSVHTPLDEDWDMYAGPNAPPDWPVGGDRWPVDEWERPPRGTPNRPNRGAPHRDGSAPPPRDIKLEETIKVEDIKKELPEVFPAVEPVAVKEEDVVSVKTEVQEVASALKRPLDTADSEVDRPEAKKVCVEESVPLEEDLSDISDDDADEILNREDIELASQAAELKENKSQAPPAVIVNGCVDSVKMETDQDKESEKVDKSVDIIQNDISKDAADQSGLQDDETIDNLDFEEISDEELEEESKVGLADALGVDWASLVADCRPRARCEVAPGSARRHWEGHRMLARIGVSVRYAGGELVDRITEKFDEINKERDKDEKVPEEERLEFLHPVAAIHVVLREKRERRKELLASAGPYKRALSARRDLLIRRQLCNLPVSEITVEGGSQNTDDIYRLAIQLFERDD